ncbi:hypothetical protein VTO73DRAFT_4737 [Trametes versicolor]
MEVEYMDIEEGDYGAGRQTEASEQPEGPETFAVRRDYELPTELLEEIFVEAWLAIPLFDSIDRWFLFSTLSLVNHQFRLLALWVSTRHVRVLSHCSTDVAAYRSIGQQYLALQQAPRGVPSSQADQEELLKRMFQHSTVHLDVTYAAHTAWNMPDLWLKDDISPGGPDDYPDLRVKYDGDASLFGEYIYPKPVDRSDAYSSWLARRRRDRLSGWFAALLAAVPDCAALVLEAQPNNKLFGITAYSRLLEAVWWWKSLAAVHFLFMPENTDVDEQMGGMSRGPGAFLPPLVGVRRVWLDCELRCTCWQDRTPVVMHAEDCIMRRLLEPFRGLRSKEDVVVPPGFEVRDWCTSDASLRTLMLVGPCKESNNSSKDKRAPNIMYEDTLWELVDPNRDVNARYYPSIHGADILTPQPYPNQQSADWSEGYLGLWR